MKYHNIIKRIEVSKIFSVEDGAACEARGQAVRVGVNILLKNSRIMIPGLFLEKSQISPIMHLLRNWEFLAHGYTRLIICTRFPDSGEGVF